MTGSWMHPVLASVLGACVGSWAHRAVVRWPADESILQPVPRGASSHRMLVHGGTVVIWTVLAALWGPSPEALRGMVFLTLLLCIAVADARTYIIPNQFTIGGAAVGVVAAALPDGPTFVGALTGAALAFAAMWTVATLARLMIGRDAMGGGDVKMMAMVGAFVGGWGALVTLFAGSLLGAIVFGPISLRTGRLVPFGVFLALGAAVAYLWGDGIIAAYRAVILASP